MLSTKNKHANWNFFSQISNSEKQHAFLPFFYTKTVCYQPRISMQNGIFFSIFSAQKNSMHFYHLSHQKLYVITKNKHTNWKFFFPDFQLRKAACIFTIFHTKNCMLSTKKNKHATWIFFLVFQTRKTACIKIQHYTQNSRFKPIPELQFCNQM